MRDPHELYELADDLPELGQPVLIQTLAGFVDAGEATRLARRHLRSTVANLCRLLTKTQAPPENLPVAALA